ncbi:NADH-dependent [FeFe] hydrogenase, group A6 [Thermanaerosceptrum fracticalcis]|nr:NADH-dependent [FeFe] hydrogenase, group A6 [Thermanaerosceptrum fracticalcis]
MMMKEEQKVSLTIDGRKVTVPEGMSVLEAARHAGVDIPSLCYLKGVNEVGTCRICVVEIEGSKNLQASCTYPVSEGLVVRTNTKRVLKARRTVLQLLLSEHPQDCLTCYRNTNCELQAMAHRFNIVEIPFHGERTTFPNDDKSVAVMREPSKCIRCRRCIGVCSAIQTAYVYSATHRGFESIISPAFGMSLDDVACITCGQCANVCPTAAIHEPDNTSQVWDALNDPEKYVIVQVAPSVRVTLGEEFGFPIGSVVTGQMVAALRKMGFAKVFDTDFTADLTIMEEGYEFLQKLKAGGPFPHLSSCSPGWIKFCEHFYPEFLDCVSTVKSPHSMFGALAKTYHAEKVGIDPAKMVVVSVMPCTAKKYELNRPEMNDSGFKDVDIAITTRELARMIRQAGIDFANLPEEEFDTPMGIASGAGLIFGATGGVIEAALRTIYEITTGKELPLPQYVQSLRGMDGLKQAEVELPQGKIRVAIAHGTGNARMLLEKIKSGEVYHFVEIMGCPGGCVGGGGQPILPLRRGWEGTIDYRMDRADSLYKAEKELPYRKSHENPAVKKLYEEFLGHPLSEKAHKLLHTSYTPRSRYPKGIPQVYALPEPAVYEQ